METWGGDKYISYTVSGTGKMDIYKVQTNEIINANYMQLFASRCSGKKKNNSLLLNIYVIFVIIHSYFRRI